jgi:hypothetical protein
VGADVWQFEKLFLGQMCRDQQSIYGGVMGFRFPKQFSN